MNKQALLTILIPTYNRAKPLLKNLEMLAEYIEGDNLQEDIGLIISNNNSPDNTHTAVKSFITKSENINIKYFCQEENFGLENNALFCLNKSTSEYIMFLGDDDYIDLEYLRAVLKTIRKDKDVYCILPSTLSVLPDGSTKPGRDFNGTDKIFEPGFNNVFSNARKGSQMSGVVNKRKGLLTAYVENEVSNIYPFIFFVGFNCTRGKTLQLLTSPVRVSAPPQSEKDWDYGSDGLIPDIFDNFNKIPGLSRTKRARLCIDFLRRDHWRFTKYYTNGGIQSLSKLLACNLKSRNVSFLVKPMMPFIFYFYSLRSK